jgi:hypothetical protein
MKENNFNEHIESFLNNLEAILDDIIIENTLLYPDDIAEIETMVQPLDLEDIPKSDTDKFKQLLRQRIRRIETEPNQGSQLYFSA